MPGPRRARPRNDGNKNRSHADSGDARALAAEVLAAVVRGTSLREALQPAQEKLRDPRDRAFATALASEGARWWLRYDKALDTLLQQPLRKREPVLHALLVLGLVQLEILQIPPHAAVAATVEATRALGRGGFARLVNAVLRRWLRERAALNARLDSQPETRAAHPRWLIDTLTRDWPKRADAILAADNAPAPPMLRVNARRATREAVTDELAHAGTTATPHPFLRDALTLAAHTDIARLPGFVAGHFSVQDGAAQIAADLLDLRDGLRVLDACAAPGGKACHMLERADVRGLALERDAARAASIGQNLRRLGLSCKVRTGDAGDPTSWWDGQTFDRILLDAPCSATGVIRRHPDIKLHRRAGDIAKLAHEQSRLLTALWPLLAPGGRLVYATCSVLREENERVVAAFLAAHADASTQAITLPAGRAAGAGWQILPGEGGLDGMYYAVLAKD
ncbi:MAG: 16S rRNA (cytosine(967)-C(5))-methyltransferase RsmB [Rhodanobacteraceae bacterium]|nr:MAG: 16S rRNA (cytosine(967)-C(5))-methyltransferase RsmB [Rhodanobacteraceae bacterium]